MLCVQTFSEFCIQFPHILVQFNFIIHNHFQNIMPDRMLYNENVQNGLSLSQLTSYQCSPDLKHSYNENISMRRQRHCRHIVSYIVTPFFSSTYVWELSVCILDFIYDVGLIFFVLRFSGESIRIVSLIFSFSSPIESQRKFVWKFSIGMLCSSEFAAIRLL